MMIDPNCKTSSAPTLDPTLFAQLTSPYFDIGTFKPFLCEVMKLAGITNVDPILYSPEPFDFSSIVLNFSSLTGVGDPRISLGHVLSAGFYNFYPMALAELEIIRSGGCKIINGYVCDSDGNKKKEASLSCPSNYTSTNITPQDIQLFTANYVYTAIDDHAKRFGDYLKTLESDGWVPTLHFYTRFYMFYVMLTKGSGVLYLKYYPDARTNLSEYLGIPIQDRNDSIFDNSNHYDAMIVEYIPNY